MRLTSITGLALQSNYSPVLNLPPNNPSVLPMIQKLFSPNPIPYKTWWFNSVATLSS